MSLTFVIHCLNSSPFFSGEFKLWCLSSAPVRARAAIVVGRYKYPKRPLLVNYGIKSLKTAKLDTTFFRDDFRRSELPLNANSTEMDIRIEDKDIVFVDDVLFTGRSIRSALTAIDSYGRPKSIELLVLIDRRFSRHLPIQPDYLGAQIDALQGDKVKVIWSKDVSKNIIYLEKKNE